ncbi:hypothetical protein LOZ58_002160 [Ophidiomyces ophidiicola]|nr:hypothetical protein LOZ65_005136 [Ophidiomyces ophidiicola]KAI1937733.1 hypothetical protein LOZ66_004014 [Ophidiomyces ophidiicola]KAI1963327.1 hypothetical protein LOZ58_002160 [Ophidiomyces ophidiicola]
MKFTAQPLVILALSSLALAAPVNTGDAVLTKKADACTIALTDRYMFSDSIEVFQGNRNSKNPSCFDWSSDGCTASPDRPAGFNFAPSCQRHDFGYRNTKKQQRFTEPLRLRIDDMFKADLYKECGKHSGAKMSECQRIADLYYAAVRRCGGGQCTNEA